MGRERSATRLALSTLHRGSHRAPERLSRRSRRGDRALDAAPKVENGFSRPVRLGLFTAADARAARAPAAGEPSSGTHRPSSPISTTTPSWVVALGSTTSANNRTPRAASRTFPSAPASIPMSRAHPSAAGARAARRCLPRRGEYRRTPCRASFIAIVSARTSPRTWLAVRPCASSRSPRRTGRSDLSRSLGGAPSSGRADEQTDACERARHGNFARPRHDQAAGYHPASILTASEQGMRQ